MSELYPHDTRKGNVHKTSGIPQLGRIEINRKNIFITLQAILLKRSPKRHETLSNQGELFKTTYHPHPSPSLNGKLHFLSAPLPPPPTKRGADKKWNVPISHLILTQQPIPDFNENTLIGSCDYLKASLIRKAFSSFLFRLRPGIRQKYCRNVRLL